jgi:2-succinyl-6-hydroxy-2,4-cyclohexadiene-1-carboxylate synthase
VQLKKIFFKEKGAPANRSIVFLHGFMGSSQDFEFYLESLSNEFHCLAFDLPGHGKSDLYEISELIPLIPKNSTIIGYSMGGRIGLNLQLRKKNLFEKGIYLSTHLGLESLSQKKLRLENEEKWISDLEKKDLKQFIDDWYRSDLFKNLKIPPYRYEQKKDFLIYAIKKFSLAKQPNFWNSLSKIKNTTFFLYGSEDSSYLKLFYRLKEASIEAYLIENAAHAIHIEKKELVLEKIRGAL